MARLLFRLKNQRSETWLMSVPGTKTTLIQRSLMCVAGGKAEPDSCGRQSPDIAAVRVIFSRTRFVLCQSKPLNL